MEFSTKVIEKMAEIMAEEMGNQIPDPQDIREVETGMRELLRKVGAEGLQRYLEQMDGVIQAQEKERDCEWTGKRCYLFRRKAVILSVFGRVHYKRRYYVCPECGSGMCPLDQRMHLGQAK